MTSCKPFQVFFLPLVLALFAGNLSAQTTWDGSASTDWSNAANWSAGVPDANDDVTIPNVSNDPTLSAVGLAKSVTVQSSAVLTITASGSLSCNGSSTKHLVNHGTINNSGSLVLGNLQASASYGVENTGTFNNNAGATFSLSNVALYTRGIWNTSTGSVTNNGKMILGQYGDVGTDAIWNDGAFNNSGCSALIHIISNGDILGTGGGATFTNSGTIIENSSYSSNISTNSGIIQNLNFGSFTATTNTGLITTEPGEIWIGCTSTNWTVASNWATGAAPAAGERVLIPDRANDPTVATGTNTSCGFMYILSGAQLTISAGASLSIDGTDTDEGLRSFGTVTNNGTLNIGASSNGGSQGLISQDGTFNNNSGAQLNINHTSTSALYNYNGTFNNSGQINIGGQAGAGQYGLYNQGIFTNNVGGSIKIDQCTSEGLRNSLSSTFHNNGLITIGSVSNIGNFGLQNWGIFNNNATGDITIDRSALYGLYNSTALTNGTVNNLGKITIGASASTGTAGIYNKAGATFNNNACGQLIFYYPLLNYSSFTNAGLMRSITSTTHANDGLTNNGVIEYPLGNAIPNVTNNDIIVKDLTGGCGATSPALTIGGANSFTAGSIWYKDAAQTQQAGTYNQGTNTFTPTNLPGAGTYTLYFYLSDNVNGCVRQVSLDYTFGTDAIPPTVVCKNATVNLNAVGSGTITTASVFQSGSDNCGTVNQQSVSPSSFTCSNIGSNLVTLTVNDGNGNTATCTATVTVSDNLAPTVVCKNATVNLNAGGTGSITTANVYQSGSDNCGTVNQVSVSPNAFDCSDAGANLVTLTVNDGHGNTATCTAVVMVADQLPPTVVCKNATVNLNAAGAGSITTASVFQSGSDNCGTVNQTSVLPMAFTCANLGVNTVTLTVTDGSGNTGTCTAVVMVADQLAPTVVCKNATVNLNAAGAGSVTTANVFQSGSDNCGTVNQVSVSPNAFICSDLGANVVTLTVNDGHGNTASCTATVTVADNTAPAVVCKNASVNLNAAGAGSITTANVFQSGSDNCGTVNQVSVSPNAFTCSNLGTNVVTLTVNDGHSNTATCTATVTVSDNTAPAVVCKNATVNLAANGSASITTANVFQSGSDNCGTVNQVSVSPNTFNCGDVGANIVTLTVNDGHSNTASCTATVTVTDSGQACNAAPTAVCQSVTVNACSATVAATQVNNGSSDPEGGPLSYALNPAGPFGVGATLVVLTVTDNGGVTATCTATITVVDNTAPTVVCKTATVNLSAAGTGSITTASVFQSGSDNCGTVNQVSVLPNAFTCSNLGSNIVTLTVNDGHGNSASCTAVVMVADQLAPTVVCKNATVSLDAAGTGGITTASVFQSGSDNCGTVNQVSVSPNAFTCSNLGANTVTLTVNDGHGNTASCTAVVMVEDQLAPTVVCKNATVNLNAAGAGSITTASVFQSGSDNCGTVNQISVSPNAFTCSNLGTNLVTLTVNDGHGNTASCTAVVMVADQLAPSVVCKNFSADISTGNGSIAITTANVFQSGTDNCGTVNQVSVSPGAFSCDNVGANIVTLTVNDGHGNAGTCTATVTITDNTQFCNAPPTAVCQNITVNANGSCFATVAATAVNNGSSDPENAPLSFAISPAGSFGLGATTVVLTVTDAGGLTSSCTATITVADNTAPTVVCKNAAIILNAASTGSITTADVYQSGSDNCGTVNPVSVSPNTFTCSNFGVNTVTLTANDGHGNTATCTASVTVTENTPPTVICKSATVNLGAAGTGSVTTAAVFQSGSDNCGTVNQVSVLPNAFTCSNLGANTVTLTVNDGHGNTATCQATVTVSDNLAPTVACQNATVNLNAAGAGSITTANIYQSGSDNCGMVNQVSVLPNTFNCGNVGTNTVTLTVNDGHGNMATCTAVVTVVDPIPPTVLCKPAILNLDASGNATLTVAQVDNGSYDNCSSMALGLSQSVFSCANIGVNIITLKAIDGGVNTASCTATVTVNDVTAPLAKCKNFTANLGAAGTVDVAAVSVDNGSSDNCSFALALTPAAFNCGNIGANMVILKATDAGGNTATCTATVTVKDVTAPTALCKNPIIYLNEVGQVTLTVANVNNGSSDACGIQNLSINNSQFDCSNISGTYPVILTVKDVNNNTATCTSTVTVKDNLAPAAVCENVTVQLNAQGKVVVYGATLAGDSDDNCSVWSYSPVAKQYTTANLGVNNLTITVKDWTGNAATCVSQVTVQPYGSDGMMAIDNNRALDGATGGLVENRTENQIDGTADLTLFPNPTKGNVTVQFQLPADQAFTLRVWDVSGRLVEGREEQGRQGDNILQLDGNAWAPGLYLIDLQSGQWRTQKRLVIQQD